MNDPKWDVNLAQLFGQGQWPAEVAPWIDEMVWARAAEIRMQRSDDFKGAQQNREWTEMEKTILAVMAANGESGANIARVLGRSRNAVMGEKSRLDVKRVCWNIEGRRRRKAAGGEAGFHKHELKLPGTIKKGA